MKSAIDQNQDRTMDMTDKRSRHGAVEMGTILMIVAFAIIAGFIYWLSGQAANERAMEIVEDTTTEIVDTSNPDAIPVSASDIMLDASPYLGQVVLLEPQTVLSLVGQQGFMLDFPTGPFLVSYSDEEIAQGFAVAPGDVVRVTGTITAMTPEIAGGWEEAGHLSEGERMVAEFAVHFLQAEDIEISTAAPAGDGA
jgi:hypothetical protein